MKRVICTTGMKGTGKSFLSRIIAGHLTRGGALTETIAFADGVRNSLRTLLRSQGLSDNEILEILHTAKEEPKFEADQCGRDLMVDFSQDFMKKFFGNDVWVKGTARDIKAKFESGADYILIDDLRFDNELEFIQEQGIIEGYEVIVLGLSGTTIFKGEQIDFSVSPDKIHTHILTDGKDFTFPGGTRSDFLGTLDKHIKGE